MKRIFGVAFAASLFAALTALAVTQTVPGTWLTNPAGNVSNDVPWIASMDYSDMHVYNLVVATMSAQATYNAVGIPAAGINRYLKEAYGQCSGGTTPATNGFFMLYEGAPATGNALAVVYAGTSSRVEYDHRGLNLTTLVEKSNSPASGANQGVLGCWFQYPSGTNINCVCKFIYSDEAP